MNSYNDKYKEVNQPNIQDLVNHFKDINDLNTDKNDNFQDHSNSTQTICCSFNKNFTIDEVNLAIKKLKRNKSCSIDGIVIKMNTVDFTSPILTYLFNNVLNSGCVPDNWSIGIITPIFKKKGSPDNPDNYRGISILSCLGKLFTLSFSYSTLHFLSSNRIL